MKYVIVLMLVLMLVLVIEFVSGLSVMMVICLHLLMLVSVMCEKAFDLVYVNVFVFLN